MSLNLHMRVLTLDLEPYISFLTYNYRQNYGKIFIDYFSWSVFQNINF